MGLKQKKAAEQKKAKLAANKAKREGKVTTNEVEEEEDDAAAAAAAEDQQQQDVEEQEETSTTTTTTTTTTTKEENNHNNNHLDADEDDVATNHNNNIANALSPRSATGVLASHPKSRDILITQFTLQCYGREIVVDANLSVNYGRRYGLLGVNASGKSTLLQCLGKREVDIPEHIDIHLLDREAPPSEVIAIDFVMSDLNKEKQRLEKEAELLVSDTSDVAAERLESVYERLDDLDADVAKTRAASILHGLGFTKVMQIKKTKEFSGGWRMRIALAKALFQSPALLLLDEPTNHLDLEACVWLEDYLRTKVKTLIIISHSQDFLNGVCTNIMHLHEKKLQLYSGNYDTYVKTRAELEENQTKKYEWEQAQIADMKEYIARFGHGSAKLARQAQSKEKTLKKMVDGGLQEKVTKEKSFAFRFEECGTIPPPVLQFTGVAFGYPKSEKGILYSNLDFGVDLDSRIALVGPNGAGKSTLLKLMVNELTPVDGVVRRHPHLRIGRYHQHLAEQLDMDLNPIEFMQKQFPELYEFQQWRSVVGRFGLTGTSQTSAIKNLSDGQKSRLAFAWITVKKPHLLLLDEPTNHLDMETIDALANAINKFEGGMVLVSHDFRLIDQVAKEIWVVDDKKVFKWPGDIRMYKEDLKKKMKKNKMGEDENNNNSNSNNKNNNNNNNNNNKK